MLFTEKKKPYVKQFDNMGNVTNQITKENPYLHHENGTRRIRRGTERIVTIMLAGQPTSFLQRRTSNGNWIKA